MTILAGASEPMTRAVILSATLLLTFASSNARCSSVRADELDAWSQTPLRVAIVGLASKPTEDSRRIESALAEAFARDQRVVLIDSSMIKPALTGVGYDGSINMSEDEARRLAAAIGCDFFIVGKMEALSRSEREGESHEEAYAGLLIVDGRTGTLAVVDFVSQKASTRDAAVSALAKSLGARAASFAERMIQGRSLNAGKPNDNQDHPRAPRESAGERVEDIPDDGSPAAVGFAPPQFLNRVKPDYTAEAEQADITASVEALVVLRSTAEIGEIHIVRWAGFGLDESAKRTIHQLKFRPATRDGKPVSVRAVIRYNFRRVAERNTGPEQLAP